jgi:hypothetical protein
MTIRRFLPPWTAEETVCAAPFFWAGNCVAMSISTAWC